MVTNGASAQVEQFLLGDTFACLAGRSAWRQGGITHRHYDRLGDPESARRMADDLEEFVVSADWSTRDVRSFVATIAHPPGRGQGAFDPGRWGAQERQA
ncbi:YqcI/YcgG family protein, partial [Streptomyces sp. NPDC059506]|uniref:YqcI/YcgG family protein n=1 Tax=Streptomyces sp. NPDC059506 TaxID=3347751 RepID=UPI00367C38C8